jgi:16S rRNA (uracil1498-N3)-methyltransferase
VSERFFCPDPPREGRYHLRGEEARHLARAARHGVGDSVELFDGKGFAVAARVVKVTRDEVELVADGVPIREALAPGSLTLATAVPKGDRFDWLVEKATEIGVARLIPLVTERAVVQPRDSKLDRLRRIIIEASKQSGRNRLMVLEPPLAWPDLLDRGRVAIGLLASPQGQPKSRWPRLEAGCEVLLAIGPEGGFSPAEMGMALQAGWHAVRFGPHVLRIETAGLAGAAILQAAITEQ